MKFLSPAILALGVLLLPAAQAQAPTPTYTPETVHQFPATQSWPSELRAGTDGRLYGKGDGAERSLWSVSRNPAAPDFRISLNPPLNPNGSMFVRNRSGLFYMSSNAIGEDTGSGIYKGCPYAYYEDSTGTRVEREKFASIVRFGADLAMEKIPVSESQPICLTYVNLTVDALDNLYFISRIESVRVEANQAAVGTRLFRLPADGRSMTAVHTFAEPIQPLHLILSQDEQWLYGISGRLGTDFGYLFRIRPDGTDYQRLHAFATATGFPASVTGAAIVEHGGYLYVALGSAGTARRGALLRIRPDGSEPLYFHSFSGDLALTGGVPAGALAVIDGAIYGIAQSGGANGTGVLYRVNPAAIAGEGTGVEVLHHFAADWSLSTGLTAGLDGKLYGAAMIGTGTTRIYVVDVGYTPPGPIVTLTADPPEVPWASGLVQPSLLTWTAQNAAACVMEGPGLARTAVATSGSQQVTPAQEGDNTYTLTCDNGSGQPDGTTVRSITVKAIAPPAKVAIRTFSATPVSIESNGGNVTLAWTTENAVSCTGSWAGGPLAANQLGAGSASVTPGQEPGEKTYTLTCQGHAAGDSQERQVKVTVTQPVFGLGAGIVSKSGGGALSGWLLLPLAALAALRRRPRAAARPA